MFDLKNKPQSPHGEQPAKPPAEYDRFNDLCATVFTTADGKELLRLMHANTIDKRSPERSTEPQLREDEAKRWYVASLERARDKGLDARAKANSKT
jgi:hypothetical protein